jgi:hydroxyacylglutathione hydrolase
VFFRQLLHDERSCASYVVGCPAQGVAAVVDPQGEASGYLTLVERHGLRITDVIDTHVHADHVSSAGTLASEADATLRLGAGAEVGFDYEPLRDDDLLRVGNRRIRVLLTPGHTPEHVCLLTDEWFVITGDTLFVGDVGRVDLALEDLDESERIEQARHLHASLQRLLRLDDHIEVYPGHYAGSTCGRGMDGKPASTIGRERRKNAALHLGVEDFVTFQLRDTPPLPQDFHEIKRANVGHEQDTAPVTRR